MSDSSAVSRRTFIGGTGAALGAGLFYPAAVSAADPFPTRPLKWICYQAAGGTADLTMRAVQPFLVQQGIKTQIEYNLGGGGIAARTELYNAEPDGYTIMVDSAPNTALSEVVGNAAFKSKEIEPIFGWSIEGWQVCTRKGAAIKNLKDLVELSKTRPITAASIGRGAASHLQLVLLRQATGMNMNIVHFSGSAQAYPQVIGGNIDIACTGPGSASRTADQLQFLAVFRDEERALPGVPSAKSQGFNIPSIDQIWYAQCPPKISKERIERLEAAFMAACKGPEFEKAQATAGLLNVVAVSRAELRKALDAGYDLAVKYQAELTAR